MADNDVGDPPLESSRPNEIQAGLRLTPDRFKRIAPEQPDPDHQRVAVTGRGDVPRFGRDPARRPHEIERGPERLGPQGDTSHRQVHLGFVSGEAVLLGQVAGELGEGVTIAIAAEYRAKRSRQKHKGGRRGAAYAMLQADARHAACGNGTAP